MMFELKAPKRIFEEIDASSVRFHHPIEGGLCVIIERTLDM